MSLIYFKQRPLNFVTCGIFFLGGGETILDAESGNLKFHGTCIPTVALLFQIRFLCVQAYYVYTRVDWKACTVNKNSGFPILIT